jgi:hypothetical protein
LTIDKLNSVLDNSPLLDFHELEQLTMEVRSDHVLYVKIKSECHLTLSDVLQIEKIMEENHSGSKFYNLFDFGHFSDLDDDVRKWASDSKGNSRTLADAIVIYSLPQRLIANFYLKVNKPPKPTKVFSNTVEALTWLKSLYN